MDFSTPDLHDINPSMDVLTIDLKSFGGLEKFYGQIVTLECPEDNSKLKELVHEEGANKVIFVQGNGS